MATLVMPWFWEFDWSRYRYFARVRRSMRRLPVYTAPYPYGQRVVGAFVTVEEGEWEFFAHRFSSDGMYISAQAPAGWVNIWCRQNHLGHNVGVDFAHVVRRSERPLTTPSGSSRSRPYVAGSSSTPTAAGSSAAEPSASSSAAVDPSASSSFGPVRRTPAGSRRRSSSS